MLEQFLADVSSLRADLHAAPMELRAVAVLPDRLAEPRWARTFDDREQFERRAHVFASDRPGTRERAVWSFELERAVALPTESFYGLAEVYGWLDPGRAAAIAVDGEVMWPIGPLRPRMRGPRWRGAELTAPPDRA